MELECNRKNAIEIDRMCKQMECDATLNSQKMLAFLLKIIVTHFVTSNKL